MSPLTTYGSGLTPGSSPPGVPEGRADPPRLAAQGLWEGAASFLWLYRGDIAAVTDESRRMSGVVTAQAVSIVPVERRRSSTSNEIAIPLSAIPVAHPEEPMSALLERMVSKEVTLPSFLTPTIASPAPSALPISNAQRRLARAGSQRAPELRYVLVAEQHPDR